MAGEVDWSASAMGVAPMATTELASVASRSTPVTVPVFCWVEAMADDMSSRFSTAEVMVAEVRVSAIAVGVVRAAAMSAVAVALVVACFNNASAPATCGEAMEVPPAQPNPLLTTAVGTDEQIEAPGAITPSVTSRLLTLLNEATASAVVEAPTGKAALMQAGQLISLRLPEFPAAMTVTTPRSRSCWMSVAVALRNESQVPLANTSVPRLMFTADTVERPASTMFLT